MDRDHKDRVSPPSIKYKEAVKFQNEANLEFTFILLDFNVHSIVDSISIYGTTVLALLSCVNDSSTPIIIPHMYYRALQVYDSLLPKQNILDSCFAQIDHTVKSDPPGHQKLLQYLHLALNQIELLFQSKVYSALKWCIKSQTYLDSQRF